MMDENEKSIKSFHHNMWHTSVSMAACFDGMAQVGLQQLALQYGTSSK
jgi:hypothetical protein